jgi:hypothetical protein
VSVLLHVYSTTAGPLQKQRPYTTEGINIRLAKQSPWVS